MDKETFKLEVSKLGINLTIEQMDLLDKFYHELIEVNKVMNLTRITKLEDVYLKHYYDSLTLYKIYPLDKKITLCDIGTGAGFPGIVLKIVFPNLKITLIDSLKKRVDYLNNLIKKLKLKDIEAIHIRAEDFSKIKREKYDVVTARAVAKTSTLLNYAIPLVKVNGSFLIMKANINNELEDAKDLIKKLEVKIEDVLEFSLPYENSTRTLIKVIKNKKTPLIFPKRNK